MEARYKRIQYAEGAFWGVFTTVVFVAAWHRFAAASALIGLVLLYRLKPSVLRIPSPDGKYRMIRYRWYVGWAFLLITIAAFISMGAFVFKHHEGIRRIVELLAVAFFARGSMVAIGAFLPWRLEYVVIKDGKNTKASTFQMPTIDMAIIEYLWMPDGESLLIWQDTKMCARLYLWDFKSKRRQVTFKDDWRWLEPLWVANGLAAESFLQANVFKLAEILPYRPASYREQVQRFFSLHLLTCADFPVVDFNYCEHCVSTGDQDEARQSYANIVSMIPTESHFFDCTRDLARQWIESIPPHP